MDALLWLLQVSKRFRMNARLSEPADLYENHETYAVMSLGSSRKSFIISSCWFYFIPSPLRHVQRCGNVQPGQFQGCSTPGYRWWSLSLSLSAWQAGVRTPFESNRCGSKSSSLKALTFPPLLPSFLKDLHVCAFKPDEPQELVKVRQCVFTWPRVKLMALWVNTD